MEKITRNILNILILILLVIILLRTCKEKVVNGEVKIIRDTTWIIKDSTVNSKPQIIKTEPYAVPIDRWNTEYLPDTNYTKLLDQYKKAVTELLGVNYYKDSLYIDSLGYVTVRDTISKNVLVGRRFSYDLHYPIIKETKTITVIEPPKRQLYWGIGLNGTQQGLIDEMTGSLMYKNKKDQMFGVNLGVNSQFKLKGGIQLFWKIKIK
jgi:hypothetical protein